MARFRDSLLERIEGELASDDPDAAPEDERRAFLEAARADLTEGVMTPAVMAAVTELRGRGGRR